ncbi:Sec-independent protein translocase protein TatB [Alphaproteobacteria bacterium]|nr:Sec-independent protein translocase protein TatB [Alphaproteobacteria bacterium]
MLDIGGWEFLVVAFVLVMVVGPKELPKMLRAFTRFTRQMRSMASEFTRGMEDLASETEVSDLKNSISDIKKGDFKGLVDSIDPTGDLTESVNETKRSLAKDSDLDEVKMLANDANVMISKDTQHRKSTVKKPSPKKSNTKSNAVKKSPRASTAKKSKKSAG